MRISHLALFEEPDVPDVAAHLHEQDVIWVGRGSVVNLLVVWRAHGLPAILRDCWQAGIVLGGESAGSLCWHSCPVTESYGGIRGVADGLGLLPYANGVHYGDGIRRAVFHRLIAERGVVGYATDTGAGVHYVGSRMVGAITDRPHVGAYRVTRSAAGEVREEPLDVIQLKRDKGA